MKRILGNTNVLFKYCEDDKDGEGWQIHLYLSYYKRYTSRMPERDRRTSWRMRGTEMAEAKNRGIGWDELREQHRARNWAEFEQQTIEWLESEDRYLVQVPRHGGKPVW